MADVTYIVAIANALLYPVNVRDGENSGNLFSIAAGGSWNGSISAPWVGNQGEMWKSIVITCPDQSLSISVFQDYWYPPYKDAIKSSNSPPSYTGAAEIPGNNRSGGSKLLYIQSNGTLSMQ